MEGYFTRNQDQSTASSEQPEDSKSTHQPPPPSPSPPFQQTYPYPPPEPMTSPANSNANSPSTAAAQPPVVVNYSAVPGGAQATGPSAGPGQPVPPHAFPFYPAAGMPPPHAPDAGDGDRNGAPAQGMPQMVPMMYPGMPMHMAYPYPPGMVPAPSMKSKRRQVKNACTNCQKACKKCDDVRPCSRCVKYGISEECADSQRKERKKGVKRGPYKKRDAKGNSEMTDPDMLGLPNGGDANGTQAMGYVAGYPPGFYSQFATGQPISKPDGGAYYPQYYLTPVAHHPPDGENMPQAPFYPAPYLGGPVPYGHQPYAAYAVAQAHPRPDNNGSPNANGAAHPYPYPYNGGRPNSDGNPYTTSAAEEKSPKGKRPENEEEDAEDGDESVTNKQLTTAVTTADHD